MTPFKGKIKAIYMDDDVKEHVANSDINFSKWINQTYRKLEMNQNIDLLYKEIKEMEKELSFKNKKYEELIEKEHFNVIDIFDKLTNGEKGELECIKYILNEKSSTIPNLHNIWLDIFNKKFNKKLTLFQFEKILEKIGIINKSKYNLLRRNKTYGS